MELDVGRMHMSSVITVQQTTNILLQQTTNILFSHPFVASKIFLQTHQQMAPSLPVSTRSPCEFKCFLLEGYVQLLVAIPCNIDEEKATLQCILDCRKKARNRNDKEKNVPLRTKHGDLEEQVGKHPQGRESGGARASTMSPANFATTLFP